MTALDTEPGDGHDRGPLFHRDRTSGAHRVRAGPEPADRIGPTGRLGRRRSGSRCSRCAAALPPRQPERLAFDETYYAKDAWSLLHNGYVQTYLKDVDGNTKNDIDADILDGHTTGVWDGDPSMVVHPEVGKWLIALGEKAFGMDPFGWRIGSAVVGALMVLVMCRLVRRLTGSTDARLRRPGCC